MAKNRDTFSFDPNNNKSHSGQYEDWLIDHLKNNGDDLDDETKKIIDAPGKDTASSIPVRPSTFDIVPSGVEPSLVPDSDRSRQADALPPAVIPDKDKSIINKVGATPVPGLEPKKSDKEPAPYINNDPLRVVMVDQQVDAMKLSTEAAHNRLEREIEKDREEKGFIYNTFVNKIWKGSLGREFLIQKYKKEALREIEENGNIFYNQIEDQDRLKASNDKTIERFISESDEVIREKAGERRERIDEKTPEAVEMRKVVQDLLSQKIDNPDLEEGSFQEIVKLQMLEYSKKFPDQDLINSGNFYINNLSKIADNVRLRAEHLATVENMDKEEAIRSVLSQVEVVTGESRNTARTELHLSKTEKLIDKINEKLGPGNILVKPDVVAGSVALASGILGFGANKVGRSLAKGAVPVLGSALFSGVLGGIEESKRLKETRALHQRQMAQGAEIANLTDLERKKLEEMEYDTISAKEVAGLHGDLKDHLPDLGADLSDADKKFMIQQWFADRRAKFSGTDEEFNEGMVGEFRGILEDLAMVDSRSEMSDRLGVDLIRYSNIDLVEEERMNIDLNQKTLKIYVQRMLDVSPELAAKVFGDKDIKNVKDAIESYKKVHDEESLINIDDKDEEFASYKRKCVGAKIAKETIKGALIGTLIQESMAFFNDNVDGLAERMINGESSTATSRTLLGDIFKDVGGNKVVGGDFISQNIDSLNLEEEINSIKIDGGTSIVFDSASGKYDLISETGKVLVNDVEFAANGEFTAESLEALRASGFEIDYDRFVDKIPGSSEIRTDIVDKEGFIDKFRDQMKPVRIEEWFHNNTENYDLNELSLDMGVDEKGQIVLSNSRMLFGDSFHDNVLGDVENTKVCISASFDTQKLNFMFDTDASGNVIIPQDHPAAKLFSVNSGEVKFSGGFIQCVNEVGVEGEESVVKPLATLIGENSFDGYQSAEVVSTPGVDIDKINIAIKTPISNIKGVEIPPFVPVYTRKEITPLSYEERYRTRDPEPGYYAEGYVDSYSGYGKPERYSVEDARQNYYPYDRRSPLGDSFDKVANWYNHGVKEANGERYAKWVEEKGRDIVEKMSPDTKLVVAVPVYAPGNAEANNFGKILQDAYAKQIADGKMENEVALMLNVNWGYDDEKDPAKLKNIEKTLQTIKEFKDKNPNIQIFPIYNTFSKAQQEASGQALNQLTKHNIDILISAFGKMVEEGKASPDFNPLIAKNDADAEAISKDYFRALIDDAEAFPETEIFTGATIFDRKIAEKNPALDLTMSIQMAAVHERLMSGGVHSAGANFACRAKAIAETGYGFNGEMVGVGKDDTQFGKMINAARKRKADDGVDFWSDVSKLSSDARIMTGADRQLKEYRAGGTGANVWVGDGFFDSQGYVSRDEGGRIARGDDIDLLKSMPESQAREEFARRIEAGLSDSLSLFGNSNEIRSALSRLNSDLKISDPDQLYSVESNVLKLTEEGKKYFFERMIKNNDTHVKHIMSEVYSWNIL